jgi:DNA helicase-2/ATP-dependent DNA helicase PcrA
VQEALDHPDRRFAFVTYTNRNLAEILGRFERLNSGVPVNVELMTWFTFLLRQCARPYQGTLFTASRIDGIKFTNRRSARGVPRRRVERYFFAAGGSIYSDKIARFVHDSEVESGGAISSRLRGIYTDLLVDEFQDLAGWDLDVVKLLMQRGPRITLVGDPRQSTYTTNPGPKNRGFRGVRIVNLVRAWVREGLCELIEMNNSYRCAQAICDFASALWPDLAPLTSNQQPGAVGRVFSVPSPQVERFCTLEEPQILRHDRRTTTPRPGALNFGESKGLEFPGVLILPTEPIRNYLRNGRPDQLTEEARSKLYVAITRARDFVGIVFDETSMVVTERWGQP